jgi:crossover junction endodeoxyribonuclease RuvC
MKILGIDPGSISCGYGIIWRNDDPGIEYISSGRIIIPAQRPLYERLKYLYSYLLDLISEYRPDEVAVEKIFLSKGIKSAINFGHTRGVILLSAALSNKPIYEYSALEVKKSVVGYGRADKTQVQRMVSRMLKINRALSSDSADALAIAICHSNSKKFFSQL